MTGEEVKAEALGLADARVAEAEADSLALGLDDIRTPGGDAVTASTHRDVDAAAPGVFNRSDYQASVSVPSTTTGTSAFDKSFADLKSGFLVTTTSDMNLALAATVGEIIKTLDDLLSLTAVVTGEAAKISVAAAAGLLAPPSRVEVQALRDSGATLAVDMSRAEAELRSGEARRRAARDRQGLLDPGSRQDLVDKPAGLGQRQGRVLEPVESGEKSDAPGPGGLDLFAPQPLAAPGLAAEAGRQTTVDAGVRDSSTALQGSVLDRVAYLAVCQALSSLDTGNETRAKAARAYERLLELVATVTATLAQDFNTNLAAGSQEMVADGISALSQALQGQLDALDTFLSLTGPRMPTFVSTVENIGDTAGAVGMIESLLADCGLRMSSFCDFQGMLEVARSLDSILTLDPQRPPRLGRVCLTLTAPEPENDYTPLITRPDREAKLILASYAAAGSTVIAARFPQADVTRALTTPVPQVYGTAAALVPAAATTVGVSGLASTPATVGRLRLEPGTPQEETLRYESFSGAYVFTLIDRPTLAHGLGSDVAVDGEHRDQFTDVYERRQEIGGGPGQLRLAGDGESAETVAYTGSIFNPATGVYTFSLSAPTAQAHRLHASGRPSPAAKTVLFRTSPSTTTPAPRFSVTDDPGYPGVYKKIVPDVSGSPADMTTEITAGDKLLLSDDVNETPVIVSSVSAASVTLSEAYHNGAVSGVSLRAADDKSPAGTVVTARLSARALAELDINPSLPLYTVNLANFTVLLGQGAENRRLRRVDGTVTYDGSPAEEDQLASAAPMFEPGDVGMAISVQARNVKREIAGEISGYVDAKTVKFKSLTKLTGSAFTQAASTFTATGGRLRSELQVGDFIAFDTVRRVVTAVVDNTTATVSGSGTVASTPSAWITAVGPPIPNDTAVARRFSLSRSPRETRNVVSVVQVKKPGTGKPETDGIWELNLTPATARAHVAQDLTIDPGVHVLPQSQDDFVSQATSVTPRFEPDVVPPGSLTLRGTFQDPAQAPVLGPLLAAGGGDVEAGDLVMPYTALVAAGDEVTVTLAAPGALRALEAGSTFCVPTASTVESLLTSLFTIQNWDVSFKSWFTDLDDQLLQLHRRLCRLLQGRPEDLAIVAAAMAYSGTLFIPYLLTLKLTMEALLAGLGDTGALDTLVSQARARGMDAAAEAMARGDVLAVAQMSASGSTSSGALMARLVVYREKLTDYNHSVQVDNMAAELRGQETSVRVLAETRAGFKTAAADDITRKLEAAKTVKARIEDMTS